MKTKLVVALLLAGSSMFAETHFSIGIGAGGYGYTAPPVVAYAPGHRSAYVSDFDRGDRYEGGRYSGDRDARPIYENNYYSDGNRVTETRGFNANRDQNRSDGNRDNGGVTSRNVGLGNGGGNQFNNGFSRR